jgi:hypothetical protein
VKKSYGIAFILIVCFSLALLNAGTSVIEKNDISISSANPIESFSDLSFNHPNSEIEISSIHHITASHGTQGFQKIVGNVAYGAGNLNKFKAFYFSDNSLPGYLFPKKYLSHIYPFHNFW